MSVEEQLDKLADKVEDMRADIEATGDKIAVAIDQLNETLRNIDTDIQQTFRS